MNVVTVSKMRDNLSNTLSEASEGEPITIKKNNKDIAVLISSRRYRELERIEDLLYKKAAELAFEEGFMPDDEAKELMTSLGADE